MNQREKLLAAGVGAVVTLFAGNSIYSRVQSGIKEKREKIEELIQKKETLETEIIGGTVSAAKLASVKKRSLPNSEESARAMYLEWLIALADDAYLHTPVPKFINDVQDSPKDPVYRMFKFQLSGNGTLETATELLYGFYSKDYLHRITQFDIRPVSANSDPNWMFISMNIEVLALSIAPKDQPEPTTPSHRISRSYDDYFASIVERNIFSPRNNPPRIEPKRSVDATVGMRLEHTIEAKDPDPFQYVVYRLIGEPQKGLTLDESTGKLAWTPRDVGEYNAEVEVWDNGVPSRSSKHTVAIKVKEPPKPAPPPKNFDVASQSVVTAFVIGRAGPEAWVHSKTDDKKYYLHKGDPLKLGSVEGKVVEIGANYIEFETEGKRWTVGQDESLAVAYARGIKE